MPRKDTDSYWFKFHPDKYLGGTAGFTLEMHGAYLVMLLHQWENGFVKKETAESVCGNLWNRIKHKFVETESGWVNIRMDEERNHKREISLKRTKAVKERYKLLKNKTHKDRYNCTTSVVQSVSDSVSVSDSCSLPLKEKKELVKKQYAENVHMTEEEYNNLITEHGEENTKTIITMLDDYKGANGKRYRSDYRAIRNWVIDSAKQKKKYKINDPDRWI